MKDVTITVKFDKGEQVFFIPKYYEFIQAGSRRNEKSCLVEGTVLDYRIHSEGKVEYYIKYSILERGYYRDSTQEYAVWINQNESDLKVFKKTKIRKLEKSFKEALSNKLMQDITEWNNKNKQNGLYGKSYRFSDSNCFEIPRDICKAAEYLGIDLNLRVSSNKAVLYINKE